MSDWPGLEKRNLFEGRDLILLLMLELFMPQFLRVLDSDHKYLVNKAFFNADLLDITKRIFG